MRFLKKSDDDAKQLRFSRRIPREQSLNRYAALRRKKETHTSVVVAEVNGELIAFVSDPTRPLVRIPLGEVG